MNFEFRPAGRFNVLYQDFVCSCVLRVAREALAWIPVDLVVVNAVSDVLDTATGVTAQEPILLDEIWKDDRV